LLKLGLHRSNVTINKAPLKVVYSFMYVPLVSTSGDNLID